MTHVDLRFVRLGPICIRSLSLLAALALLAAASFAQITEDSVITLTTNRPPVTQSFIESPPPAGVTPTAVLIMLVGNYGTIQLTPVITISSVSVDGTLDVNSGHFLTRSRWLFASLGFYVISLDDATDFQALPTGLEGQQSNPNHIADILQVIAFARSIPGLPANVPVWLVGSGSGTAGAWVSGAPNPPPIGPDGLVFMSPVNVSGDPDSLLSAPLADITVPTLLFNNKASTCAKDLASADPPLLKDLTDLTAPNKANENVNNATYAALSTDCLSLSPHGYFGDEPEAVTKVTSWIAAFY